MPNPTPTSAHPRIPKRRLRQAVLRRGPSQPLRASGYIPDISEFQGAVDWAGLTNAYASGTIQGVIMRASFGTSRPDNQFYRNRDSARALGIPRAFYHYCYPDYNSAAAEASFFNSVVGGLQASEAMIADFEEPGLTEAWAATFMADTESPQANTIWYGAPYFSASVGLYVLSNIWPYWVADYGVSSPPGTGSPAMWQYTDRGYNQWDTSVMLRGRFTDLLTGSTPAPGPTPGPSPAPDPPAFVPIGGSKTMIAFDLSAQGGTGHQFDLSPGGDVLWGRFTGGAGGQIHGQFVNIGGSGPGPVIEFTAWPDTTGQTITVRTKYADGSVLQVWLDANGPWPQTLNWFAPDEAGPFGLSEIVGPAGKQGPSGPPYDDTALKQRIAVLEQDLANIKKDIQ